MRSNALQVLALAALLHGAQAHAQAGAGIGAGTAVQGAAARAAVAAGAAGAAGGAAGSNAGAAVQIPAGRVGNVPPGTGARYVEACQQAIERGVVNTGCQGTLYQNEISRLKQDALRTNNPSLLTLLGDAYQSNRSGVSDIGQAYRWYLLGAVRGDPRAMQRLSQLYESGQGAPKDNVKALGYARLAQRLAPPGSTSARQATETITSLAGEMAAEETALAERFASDLEASIRKQGGLQPGAGSTAAAPAPPSEPKTASTLARLPGMGAVQAETEVRPPPAQPGSLPGRGSLAVPPGQP